MPQYPQLREHTWRGLDFHEPCDPCLDAQGASITCEELAFAVSSSDPVCDTPSCDEVHLAQLAQTAQALDYCLPHLSLPAHGVPERGDHVNHSGGSGAEGQGSDHQECVEGEGETGFETSPRNLIRLLSNNRH